MNNVYFVNANQNFCLARPFKFSQATESFPSAFWWTSKALHKKLAFSPAGRKLHLSLLLVAISRAAKIRLDCLLVERGHFVSREQAQRSILAGEISSPDGHRLDKPGHRLAADTELVLRTESRRYVGRGGWKLAAALDAFQISPADHVCIDVGASTGGFTDCLLQRGATRIYAVDVGHGQLDWSLRQDPRVVVREKTNARTLRGTDFPEAITLGVVDVSFISLTLILPALGEVVMPAEDGRGGEGVIIALIKPQFELGRAEVSRGAGVVRDPEAHARAVTKIEEFVAVSGMSDGTARRRQWRSTGVIESPVRGAQGNKEFLICLRS